MEIKLHSNATTTPRTRKYIQRSDKTDSELASELNISIDTVRRWRNRGDCYDKSHRPKTIHKSLMPEQELLLIYLRTRLNLSLDELLECAILLINQNVSRASLSRCLKSYQIGRIEKPKLADGIGHVILDCFLLPAKMTKNRQYLFVFIEKFTSHISFALSNVIDINNTSTKIVRYLTHELPYKIRSVETSADPVAQQLAHLISDKIFGPTTLNNYHELLTQINSIDFNRDYVHFINGTAFDKRLGSGAILLEYEDILNQRIIRNRLKSLSPTAYLRQYISNN